MEEVKTIDTIDPANTPPISVYRPVPPLRHCLINPNPDIGNPVPTEGLKVTFDSNGVVLFTPVADPNSRFCIGPTAALQLAQLIMSNIDSGFFLAT